MAGAVSDPELFATTELRPQLRRWLSDAVDQIDRWPAESLASLSDDEVIAKLLASYSLEVPAIDREGMSRFDPVHLTLPNNGPAGGVIRVADHRIAIPFTGSAAVLNARSGRFMGIDTGPRARIDKGSELIVTLRALDSEPAALKSELNRFLAQVQQGLDWAKEDIAAHEESIRSLGPRIAARRASIADVQAAAEALNIPKRQPDRVPAPPPVPTAAAIPVAEPVDRSRADFARAVEVLARAKVYLQRHSSMTEGRNEEQVRDQLGFALDVTKSGDVSAEARNGSGRTDILLKVNGRNALIAECKFWKGQAQFSAAIDQLLRYITWDDRYAAIPLFIRDVADVEAAIDKARATLEAHGQTVRCVDASTEDHWEFVMRTAKGREITVVLMPFVIA